MATIVPAPAASGIVSQGLSVGTPAPDLVLLSTPDGRRTNLADHRGSPVVLVFYPGDFTPVCTSELGLYNELLPELGSFGAKVFALSCDSLWSHLAYAKELNLQVPLLSDFHPKAEVSRRYQVFRDDIGTCERALFVIDGEGKIFWAHVSPIEQNPGADGVLDALERLTGKELESPTPATTPRSAPLPPASAQPAQAEATP